VLIVQLSFQYIPSQDESRILIEFRAAAGGLEATFRQAYSGKGAIPCDSLVSENIPFLSDDAFNNQCDFTSATVTVTS
jgi:hypothetical protein